MEVVAYALATLAKMIRAMPEPPEGTYSAAPLSCICEWR